MELQKLDDYSHIYQVDCFSEEFYDVTKEKRSNGRHHKWLRNSLDLLEKWGAKALNLKNFECLKNTDPKLFAIRYPKSEKNPRVIFVFADGMNVHLLTIFKEKSKKDYDSAIKIAHNRLKSIQQIKFNNR